MSTPNPIVNASLNCYSFAPYQTMNPRIILAIASAMATAHALELGAPFTDNAILQRGMPVPVWGWGKPGEEFTVTFATQEKTTKAAENGKWLLQLDPLQTNAKPATLNITGNGKSITLNNILVGEVWMASGQSNMQWIASKSSVLTLINQLKENGETPPIREFQVHSTTSALHPIERATGAWKVEDYGNHSAVAFAFALKLHGELNVPIGILNCSFSETSIESWIPRQGFAAGTDAYTRSVYQKILETNPSTPQHKNAWDAYYQSLQDNIKTNAELVATGKPAKPIPTSLPGNLRSNRDPSWMFNGRIAPVVPYAIRGAIWNQGYANMHAGLQYYHNLHSLIRGWRMVWEKPELPVYFNQFYCPGNFINSTEALPAIGDVADMRLGTWLARDIPHTGMASQIDIDGAIHYQQKAIPGRRLALHALKNQYAKNIVADGPMFKSYTVQNDKLIVEFEHADGGLVIGETATNSSSRPNPTSDGLATPVLAPGAESKLIHFHLAGEDRVWHPASVRLDGTKAIITSPAVKNPRGVSYATGGIGFRHGLYNKALLPASPFIYYDNQLVTADTWPDDPIKIANVENDPATVGLPYEYRRLPLLSTQFRDNAVLRADMPVTIFGASILYTGYQEKGECFIHFKFGDIEKTIPVTPGMEEWSVTIPPNPASTKPHTLQVSFHIDGELVHQRICENIIFGDLWYVASPPLPRGKTFELKNSGQSVRVINRVAKRTAADHPSRFSVATSSSPDNNRFASFWHDAEDDLAAAISHRIAAKTKRPTGIIFMDSGPVPIASWMSFKQLKNAPSLRADYENLAQVRPGNEFYDQNTRNYLSTWRNYWSNYVPQLIATRAAPDGANWGQIPPFAANVTSKATHTHNVLTASFIPGSYNGVIFLAGPAMIEHDQGTNFTPELATLALGWDQDFGGKVQFIHTIPDQTLAPKITKPSPPIPNSTAITITTWDDFPSILDGIEKAAR